MRVPPLVVAALLLAGPVRAQSTPNPPGRLRPWFSAGVAAGYQGARCARSCNRVRDGGPSLLLGAGVPLAHGVRVGAELEYWVNIVALFNDAGQGEHLLVLAATLQYTVPAARRPEWRSVRPVLKAGVGQARYSTGSGTIHSEGLALLGGVSLEVPVGERRSLTPFVNYMRALNGKLRVDGQSLDPDAPEPMDFRPSLLQIGVAITWEDLGASEGPDP